MATEHLHLALVGQSAGSAVSRYGEIFKNFQKLTNWFCETMWPDQDFAATIVFVVLYLNLIYLVFLLKDA